MTKVKSVFVFLALLIFLQVPLPILADVEAKTPSGIPIRGLEEQVDAFLREQLKKTTPSLAIAVVKDEELVLLKGYGYADIQNKVPVDPRTTVYEFGSISKLFVWTAAMQMVEQGKLKLDVDIKNYLPAEFAKKLRYQHEITMLDLMNHCAGFEQQPFDWLPVSPEAEIKPLEQSLLEHQPKQVYKPGEVIAYSNYGTALAGFIIEQLSGKPFYDYEMDSIFKRLGMNSSSGNPILLDKPELLERKAKGYIGTSQALFLPGIWSVLWHYPAGSVNGTVEDLGRFLLALLSEKSPLFQNQATLSQMLTKSFETDKALSSNAHGFWEYEIDKGNLGAAKAYWHPGNTASFSTFFAFVPEEKFGVAIVTNATYAIDPTYGLCELLLGKPKGFTGESNGIVNTRSGEALPPVSDLAGMYMYSMRSHTGIFEAASYLVNLVSLEVFNSDTLIVKNPSQTSAYVQTSPYVYELVSTDYAETPFTHPKLYVEMENGKVKRITGGHIMDILPLPKGRSLAFFWFSFAFAILSALYFIISLILVLIRGFLNRIWPKEFSRDVKLQNLLTTILITLGTLLILNNLYIIFKAFELIPLLTTVKGNIYLNWFLLILIAAFEIGNLFMLRRLEITRRQRVILTILMVMLTATIVLLFNWNFFNMRY